MFPLVFLVFLFGVLIIFWLRQDSNVYGLEIYFGWEILIFSSGISIFLLLSCAWSSLLNCYFSLTIFSAFFLSSTRHTYVQWDCWGLSKKLSFLPFFMRRILTCIYSQYIFTWLYDVIPNNFVDFTTTTPFTQLVGNFGENLFFWNGIFTFLFFFLLLLLLLLLLLHISFSFINPMGGGLFTTTAPCCNLHVG